MICLMTYHIPVAFQSILGANSGLHVGRRGGLVVAEWGRGAVGGSQQKRNASVRGTDRRKCKIVHPVQMGQ